ncbi:unnamed protein product [Prunus brigantina]
MTGIVTLSCMLDAVHNGTSSKDYSYFKKVYDSFTHMVHAIGSLGSDSCSGSIIRVATCKCHLWSTGTLIFHNGWYLKLVSLAFSFHNWLEVARACTDAYVFKDTEESNFKVESQLRTKKIQISR